MTFPLRGVGDVSPAIKLFSTTKTNVFGKTNLFQALFLCVLKMEKVPLRGRGGVTLNGICHDHEFFQLSFGTSLTV